MSTYTQLQGKQIIQSKSCLRKEQGMKHSKSNSSWSALTKTATGEGHRQPRRHFSQAQDWRITVGLRLQPCSVAVALKTIGNASSLKWSDNSHGSIYSTTNTKPRAHMQVNQHVFGSTHISFVSYAEPFTSSASSMETCESERWFRACYFSQAKDWRITGYRTTAMPCSSGARDN